MNMLVIGPSWVGDMVMSQSLYIALKQQNPDALIDVMAPAWCKPILERMPEVNRALELPFGHGEFQFFARRKLGLSLRGQYDHAYVLPNSAKSALIAWFAGIPVRTGWKGEMRYGLLNDLRNNKKQFQYMTERYVALAFDKATMTGSDALGGLDKLPRPKLTITPEQQQATAAKFSLSLDNTVGLCPGAEFGPAKQWPTTHYAQVASYLLQQGKQVWLFGSTKDRVTTEAIIKQVPETLRANLVDLAGKTSLIEAVDLLSCCQTVISNDSGLMHVAGAAGCQVIGVYGSTSPHYTPPLAEKSAIVHTEIECRPCFKRQCPYGHLKCLTELAPQQVITALQAMEPSSVGL
ncbi:lipopolysaccharide heptosyltransferase II [Vibrio cholerae]|uniref:lipopolysaccharide heptosyltransferase II n=1 Tax=Vibrio TaxID=662 RepID=UPI00028F059A|nr:MULTISPECIES: lipopolysaccharide heptosyltransferase II [Vibrio]EGQ9417282.1 lipopolysaccharide heptosyltransferase II [Vibrio cholerae]EGR1113144.1 lipopolysaccharide heptosyltransferase II [Vibrio cholerae]EGR4231322.1 lipopolysaccharide heptosyltransferase II [Vibrio cholerae]EGR4261587.1 lipopolysaccharide heptosyltransferase II [Vibrio cholerae]EJL9434991.1 lipopolysaccharide heptosyltransferase II [Vibrio cholerae]